MPRYQVPCTGLSVKVSLSRSGDWCLLAGTTDYGVVGVGVDMEKEGSAGFDGFDAVAMTARERELLQGMSPSLKALFQTRLWARKEAVLKALGIGLMDDPAVVDVSSSVPLVRGRTTGSERWVIEHVDPASVGLPKSFFAVLALQRMSQQTPRDESD